MSSILRDLRNGAVSLWRNPAYTAVATLTLAVGVGASISMFSVIQGVLLRPLPYERPEQLVMLWHRYERTGAAKVQLSPNDVIDFRERATTFSGFAALRNSMDASITGESTGEQINLTLVTSNLFDLLGRPPALGRSFTEADERFQPRTNAPAILSHDLWLRRYGADEGIVGQSVEINGARREIVGVMPEDFELLLAQHDGGMVSGGAFDEVDVWAPVPYRWMRGPQRGFGTVRVLARLGPGSTLAQARQEMTAIAAELRNEHAIHEQRGVMVDVVPLYTDVVGDVRPMMLALFGAVGVVLLIACANAANLALVRATGRTREVAIRAALGGTRGRIVRELLAEAAVLAVVAGSLGVAFAAAATNVVVSLAPADVPRIGDVGMDVTTLLFASGMSALAVLLSGVVPALRAASPQLASALKDGSPSTGRRSAAGRNAVVVAEVALSMVLLVVGALLVQSFAHMARTPLGFEVDTTMTMKVSFPSFQLGDAETRARVGRMRDELRASIGALPGVEAVADASPVPFGGRGLEVPYSERPVAGDDWAGNVAERSVVSAGFFEALGARIVSGRSFTSADMERAKAVAEHNQAAARAAAEDPEAAAPQFEASLVVIDGVAAAKLFGGADPLGREIWLGSGVSDSWRPYEVVGVVEHIRHDSIAGADREAVFVPATSAINPSLVVRATGDPRALLDPIAARLRDLDPQGSVYEVRTFAETVGDELAANRFAASLATAFAALAVGLAAVGLYGVIAYSVTQRTRDFGVRIALGAGRDEILRLVIGQGLALVIPGVVVGAAAAFAASRLIGSLLYGVTPTDATTFLAVGLLLVIVTVLASYVPARRATRVDPLDALRFE